MTTDMILYHDLRSRMIYLMQVLVGGVSSLPKTIDESTTNMYSHMVTFVIMVMASRPT